MPILSVIGVMSHAAWQDPHGVAGDRPTHGYATARSVGSVLLSGIYVKLGWVGLAKFGTAGTGGASPTLAGVAEGPSGGARER